MRKITDLEEILIKHAQWRADPNTGKRADLSDVDLFDRNLSGVNLSHSNLIGTDFTDTNLSHANLAWANLPRADLSFANLIDANLSGTNLTGANLTGANLFMANLTGANLSYADLTGTNLSGAKGLLDPVIWMSDNFTTDDKGYIVYRAFGNTNYPPSPNWVIEPGSIITEVVNPLPTVKCGCGVSFGTLGWVKSHYTDRTTWRCRIRWIDLPSVVVPYNTDGKARCGRLELLEIVEKRDN